MQLNILHLKQTLLYIESSMNYPIRGNLKIYKTKELESIFIEAKNSKGIKSDHWLHLPTPQQNPTEFIDIYISELLRKISRDDKIIMLIAGFNRDLLKYDINTDSATFLDSMFTNNPNTYKNTL